MTDPLGRLRSCTDPCTESLLHPRTYPSTLLPYFYDWDPIAIHSNTDTQSTGPDYHFTPSSSYIRRPNSVYETENLFNHSGLPIHLPC